MRLDNDYYIDFIELETERLIDAARTVPLGTRVPTAPDWDVAALLWHLTEVQTFWSTVVAERLMDPEGYREPDRPHDDGLLVGSLDSAKTFLVRTLREADPQMPCYTWSTEKNAGFVMRRQAHEALIHRADAEAAAGRSSALDPALAQDGVDEILNVFIAGIPEWAMFTDAGKTVRIDDREWRWDLLIGRMTGTSPNSGKTYDIDAAVVVDAVHQPDATITGTASRLDLWLWGRAPLAAVEVTGDPALATLLRQIATDATQ